MTFWPISPLITRVRSSGVFWAVVIVSSAAQAGVLKIRHRPRERAIVVLKMFIQKGVTRVLIVNIQMDTNCIQQIVFYYSGSRRFKGRFEGI